MLAQLESNPEKLIENVLPMLDSPTPHVLQSIFECYERSVARIDPKASEDMKYILKAKRDKFLPHSPLYLLGQCLEANKKVKVSYCDKQTAASEFTMLHLTTRFGERWRKGEYLYEDNEYFNFNSICQDHLRLK